ncbi:MAG: energy-coupling factor transporter ATPase [Acholeplasmatales bacterium]|jgi:energy-coupling factor transport system ATP-binding protein|nr:energy-coupling factor transporter ATPase [Acholeplasmatales bacterium]
MIELKNVSFSYTQGKKTIDDVNLVISDSSWVSIIGHNGSGKSTLAKLLVGLLIPNNGEIKVNDIIVSETNLVQLRKCIGIVFQNPDNQFVGVTVKNDIAFGLENLNTPYEEMLDKIDIYSKLVSMNEYLDMEPHNLSGGQKQRVALASALAMEQSIVIFDEATSMLDPKGSNEIIDLIRVLNKEKKITVITITHDLEFAKNSDYIYVLKKGKIILEGIPEDVYSKKNELLSSNLILPYINDLYEDIKDNSKIKEEVKEIICQLSLIK